MTRSRWSRRSRARKARTRFSPDVLTNPSGFAGIDGLFRFRADGTNERGLAVMKVTTGGGVAGRGLAEEFWGCSFVVRMERSAIRASLHARKRPDYARSIRATDLATPPDPRPLRPAPEIRCCVTRRRPVASTVIAPSSRSSAMRLGSSGRPDSAL